MLKDLCEIGVLSCKALKAYIGKSKRDLFRYGRLIMEDIIDIKKDGARTTNKVDVKTYIPGRTKPPTYDEIAEYYDRYCDNP